MNETLALSPRLVLRDLMLTAFSQKARVCLIFFCIMALSIVIATLVQPDYKVKSSLLVLMGTEHSFRPAAGQQFVNSGGVDAEQILRTESSIIGSDDLHRTVIPGDRYREAVSQAAGATRTRSEMDCRYTPFHNRYAWYNREID